MKLNCTQFTSLLLLGFALLLGIHFMVPNIALSQSSNNFQTIVKADELFLAGNTAEAEKLYRKAKPSFTGEAKGSADNQVINDPSQLSGAAAVYWREAQRGLANNLEDATLIPLKLLVEKQPRFVPGHMLMIEALKKYGKDQDSILAALEKAASQFPESPELTKLQAKTLAEADKFLEASVAARQFSVLYPDHEEAAEFGKLADTYFGKFQSRTKQEMIVSGILSVGINIATGAGLDQPIQLLPLLLQGETGMGNQLAANYTAQLPLLSDTEVLKYVNEIGQSLVALIGRKDLKYEFYVVNNPELNAFALPGGKIFINSGIILAANSEAELAGVIGHEIAHATLSHTFQRLIKGNLIGSIGQTIPLGNLLNLAVLSYDRDQEKQSDILSTRGLASAQYAADGLRNMMVTLSQKSPVKTPEYLAVHPAPTNRIRYLEELIKTNGYNRYALEGVKDHTAIKQRLQG